MKKAISFLFVQTIAWASQVEKEAAELAQSQIEQTLKQVQSFSWKDFIEKSERANSLDPDQMLDAAENLRKGKNHSAPSVGAEREVRFPIPKNLAPVGIKDPCTFETLVPDLEKKDPKALSKVMSKLSVFREMKRDLESQGEGDVRNARVFQGEDFRCSHSKLGNALYDCCQSMKGVATRLYLAKCSAEEVALSKMREEGKCVAVGSFKKRTVGVTKEKRRVFCCFSSKLARIFQEEGRKQLKKSWGAAKTPDCRGLSFEEIERINFDRINLSGLFEDFETDQSLQSHIESFRDQLQESQGGS